MAQYLDLSGLQTYHGLLVDKLQWCPETTTTGVLDLSNAKRFTLTVSANRTISFSGTPQKDVDAIWVKADVSGDYTVTWPSNVTWAGGKPPSLEYLAKHEVRLETNDCGETWIGSKIYSSDRMVFTVNTQATASGEKTTGIPFNLYNQSGVELTVDWGDGNVSTLTASDYAVSDSRASVHEYSEPGVYTVTIGSDDWDDAYVLTISSTNSISTVNNAVSSLYWWRRTLVSVDERLPKLAGRKYYSSPTSVSSLDTSSHPFSYLFVYCTSLTVTPSGLFDSNTAATDFSSCFWNCTSLTAIPAGLFDSNTAVTDFSRCFQNCTSLTAIPSGLFDSNTAVTTFYCCFLGCSSLTAIPAGLFDSNTAVTSFGRCFQSCTSLTAIPAGLFDSNTAVTSFQDCFSYCSSLTAIPSGLFNNNTAVTTFSNCFYSCTSLAAIPAGLFASNTAVTSFKQCFYQCSSLADFTLHIGSSSVSNCSSFVSNKSGATRTIYVPSGSTTQTKFNAVASSLGLTIVGE